MHVFLFGVIRILEEMKTLSSSFAGRQPAADAADGLVCGTTLWHVGSFSGA
jgi:hypothetical protein